jgi:hypothetical protein
MADHLQYRGAEVETYTPHGEWLAELLHLGERRALRELVLSALSQFLTIRNELLQELTAYEALLEEKRLEGEPESLQVALQETNGELERVDRQIELLIGESVAARRSG